MFQRQSLTRFAGAPFAQGSHESVRFSALCRRENRSKNQGFKTESGSKTKVSHSPSVAFGASSLSEGAFVRAYFFLSAAADGTLRTAPRGIFAALCLASVLKIKNHRQSRRYFCGHMYIWSLHTSASMMGAPFHLHSSRNIFLTLSCALRKILSIDISVQIR